MPDISETRPAAGTGNGPKPKSVARKWLRRILILSLLAGGILLMACTACSSILKPFAGASKFYPADAAGQMTPEARALVERSFGDLEAGPVIDNHVHLVGLDECGNGNRINPEMRSWLHPGQKIRYIAYMSGGRIVNEADADKEYLARLLDQAAHFPKPVRLFVLAMDMVYSPDGRPLPEITPFFVSNDYVLEVAQAHPGVLEPVGSVHPYRPDALAALDRLAARGVRLIKWLPNGMGMDPADPAIEPFYRRMVTHGMTMLTHTGEEKSFKTGDFAEFGNPLRWRRALDLGLRVIMAHAGTTGKSRDLDAPGQPLTDNFRLFIRMMDEPRYAGLLFADISAVTQFNRTPEELSTLLERTDWQPRLVNGSDYPLPAINALVPLGRLRRNGFISAADEKPLREIYHFNPLLFDFVLKRSLRHPRSGQTFAPAIFTRQPGV